MISTEPAVLHYTCNGSTTAFDFGFRIQSDAQLRVVRKAPDGTLSDLALNSDYTVEDAGQAGGGTVHTIDENGDPLAYAGGELVIGLGLPITQTLDYVENDRFPAESHEGALDKLTLVAAQTRQDVGRAPRVPFGDCIGPLPRAALRGGRFMAFDQAGDVIVVPAIDDPIVIEQMDQASIYMDRNADTEPRLVLDVAAQGTTPIAEVGGGQAIDHGTVVMQDVVPLKPSGLTRFFVGMLFKGQDPDAPIDITNKRSRNAVGISVVSQISTEPDPNPARAGKYMPQEVGCLALTATAAASSDRAKLMGIVVSAREEDGLADDKGSKGVAIQAITQRATPGPKPDDRSQVSDNEDGESGPNDPNGPDDAPDGNRQGSFTLRLNGGTIKQADETGELQSVFGGWRSWSAIMAGGRAGYFNGLVMTKRHSVDPEASPPQTDPENVGGWGGVWGGRSYWHMNTMAIYAKDACPGWLTVGHDGVPVSSNGEDGIARAPLDVVVTTVGGAPAQWTGADRAATERQAVLMFNGLKLLGARSTGWTAMTAPDMAAPPSKGALAIAQPATAGASYNQALAQTQWNRIAALEARLAALDAALFAHGLIGA